MNKLNFGNATLILFLSLILISPIRLTAQTFFETASGDGIINFQTSKSVSQFKLDLTSKAIGFNWTGVRGNGTSSIRFLYGLKINAKTDDDGVAKFLQGSKLQSGFSSSGSLGLRIFPKTAVTSVIDIAIKPEFSYNAYNIYDSTRLSRSQDPVYKPSKSTYGGNLLINYGIFPGKMNFYAGAQIGIIRGNNLDELTSATIQTVQPYPGSTNKTLMYDNKEVKKGQLTNTTLVPLKIDLLVDPRLALFSSAANSFDLGFFGYYRTDLKASLSKQRAGAGVSFLNDKDPSKVFMSLGCEFPTFGAGAGNDEKGFVFATIGYTIK